MTSTSRTAQFAKIHKVLKKCYKASPCNASRTVLEQLLFACCLEDAHHDAAEEAFASLVHTFFDWNEVRVTSISELSEVMAGLPDPRAAANRIKRVLHAVFEATFNFDLDGLAKKNLGPTVKWFEKLDGTTPFTVAYVVQAALGGHAIPIDAGALAVLRVLDLVTDKDVSAGVVPGLERAIAKSKGVEFGSLLHELGADYSGNAYSRQIRDVLVQIDPECEKRLPKRRVERAVAKKAQETADKTADKAAGKAAGKAAAAPQETKAKPAARASAPEKPSRKKSAAAETPPPAETSKKKSAHHAPASKSGAEKSLPRGDAPKKRSASEGLAKRKPR